jgi:Family of unknown function (DUF6804)
MDVKAIPWWIWLIPVALLLLATARMPYGYYTLLRIVVCLFAVCVAITEWDAGALGRGVSIAFGVVALLFNPLVPIFLKRATWHYIDIGIAVLIAAHLVFRRLRIATISRQ